MDSLLLLTPTALERFEAAWYDQLTRALLLRVDDGNSDQSHQSVTFTSSPSASSASSSTQIQIDAVQSLIDQLHSRFGRSFVHRLHSLISDLSQPASSSSSSSLSSSSPSLSSSPSTRAKTSSTSQPASTAWSLFAFRQNMMPDSLQRISSIHLPQPSSSPSSHASLSSQSLVSSPAFPPWFPSSLQSLVSDHLLPHYHESHRTRRLSLLPQLGSVLTHIRLPIPAVEQPSSMQRERVVATFVTPEQLAVILLFSRIQHCSASSLSSSFAASFSSEILPKDVPIDNDTRAKLITEYASNSCWLSFFALLHFSCLPPQRLMMVLESFIRPMHLGHSVYSSLLVKSGVADKISESDAFALNSDFGQHLTSSASTPVPDHQTSPLRLSDWFLLSSGLLGSSSSSSMSFSSPSLQSSSSPASSSSGSDTIDPGLAPILDAALMFCVKARQRCSRAQLRRLVVAHWRRLHPHEVSSSLSSPDDADDADNGVWTDKVMNDRLATLVERGYITEDKTDESETFYEYVP